MNPRLVSGNWQMVGPPHWPDHLRCASGKDRRLKEEVLSIRRWFYFTIFQLPTKENPLNRRTRILYRVWPAAEQWLALCQLIFSVMIK